MRSFACTKTVLIIIIAVTLVALISTDLCSQTDRNRVKLAQGYERRGDYEAALRIYRALFAEVPKNLVYYEGVKRNLSYLKRYDELKRIISERILETGDPRYFADMGTVHFQEGDREQAFERWNEILRQAPQQKLSYTHVANAMMINRLYDEAVIVYQQARLKLNEPDLFVFELANAFVLRLKYHEATTEYLNYLEKNPNQFSYIEGRIASYTKEKTDAELVAGVIKERLQQTEQEYLMRKLLADLYLRIEDYANALQEFKRLENTPQPQQKVINTGKEIYFFADRSLRAGNYAYAEDAYNIILMKYPKSPYRIRALYGLANAKQNQGLATEALLMYDKVIKEQPGSVWAQQAWYQKGEIYYTDLVDIENTKRAMREIIEKHPKSKQYVAAHFRQGDCYLFDGDTKRALEWYKRGSAVATASAAQKQEGLYRTAYALFLTADYDEALVILRSIIDDTGQQEYVNDALELMFFIQENQDEEKEALEVYSRSMLHKFQHRYDLAISSIRTLVNDATGSVIVEPALLELARLYSLNERYPDAINNLEKLLNEFPESIHNDLAQKRIAEIYENNLADHTMAIMAYEKVLINYPSSVYLEEVRQRLRHLQTLQLNN